MKDSNDEISLSELFRIIVKDIWFILLFTLTVTVVSGLVAYSIPNQYKATAILAPTSESAGAGGLTKLAGQFGGLASLAGLDLNSVSGESNINIALEIMTTWGFIEKFIDDNNIAPEVFAANGWNRKTNELDFDKDIYDSVSDTWVREFDETKGESQNPTSWELFESFRERVSVVQEPVTGFIEVSIEYYSPMLAKQWVDLYVAAINKHVQIIDQSEASKTIEYLKEKVKETNLSQMQNVFYQLIEEQTKTLMLAEVSDEYVFRTISAAKVSEKKSKPNRLLIIAFSTVFGLFIAVVISLVRQVSFK